MKQKIKFANVQRLEDILDSLPPDVDEFTIAIEENGDMHLEMSADYRTIVEHHSDTQAIGPTAPLGANPPRWAEYLLLLIPIRNREHLIGDLEQEFRTFVLPRYGRAKAGYWYWLQAVASLAPFLVRLLKRALGITILFKVIWG